MDSKLVTKFVQAASSNYTASRAAYGGSIKKITIHHIGSVVTMAGLAALFQIYGRGVSSHYGVVDLAINQFVRELNVAHTDGNWPSNISSVTIEVGNSANGGQWPVSDASLRTLIKLCADIAKRNNLGRLVPRKNLTWHNMYVATLCPGPYLQGLMQYIADEANKINESGEGVEEPMYISTNTNERIKIGPMTGGDYASILALAKKLVGATEIGSGMIVTGKANKGDQITILKEVNRLGINFSPYHEAGNQAEVDSLKSQLAKANTERDNAKKELTDANKVIVGVRALVK